ncbi:MAG: 23S rRNA methyltransferase [Gammaproteobacteria bacterium]|nr:23S rRNA methyltransferase [Gammaproteobacteria bacterium]MDH3909361.1 23S rRNA methyltransferase [Gammaproteobacteria bacterium]MDH3953416.1 23S rRNA methyltransferase [Gammaproteobacteria bacterium]NCF61181.1 23S rRNA methyltransferase [Gammaproteobacteria bacterium]
MSKPRRSSGTWRERQERDPFVVRARSEGWRSRAVYKLEQIDKKEKLLRPDMVVVDLGAAPGSWSQYVVEKLKGRVHVIALDILEMDALPSVEFIQGDFREDDVLQRLEAALRDERADLVISDMAPNISGNKSVDQPRSMYLAELALDLCERALKPGGDFVCKLFQGEGSDAFIAAAKQRFAGVRVMKPEASRPGSREVYLVARNYRL